MVGLTDEVLPVFLRGVGALPLENFENEEYRRSHLRPFCSSIKVLRLPELSIFVDVSEKKIIIFFYAF